MSEYRLRLYVTGRTPRSQQAITNLQRIVDEDLGGQFEVEVIDILEHPQLAEEEKILATPTLIRDLPEPIRRVVGDLSETERVLLGLDLQSMGGSTNGEKSNGS